MLIILDGNRRNFSFRVYNFEYTSSYIPIDSKNISYPSTLWNFRLLPSKLVPYPLNVSSFCILQVTFTQVSIHPRYLLKFCSFFYVSWFLGDLGFQNQHLLLLRHMYFNAYAYFRTMIILINQINVGISDCDLFKNKNSY